MDTTGANKTAIIAAVLRARLASVLICDQNTAGAALRVLGRGETSITKRTRSRG
ncbi:MAG: hypothetical protein H0T80_20345 [Betaproteobacteria bacterium]|nr:hypothetical protein [Betaproteobacteria bacterium]